MMTTSASFALAQSPYILDQGERIELSAADTVDIPSVPFSSQNTAIVGVHLGALVDQPYIFIHGFSGNLYNFDEMIRQMMSQHSINAYAFNWGAQGYSTPQWDLVSGTVSDGSYRQGQHNMDEGIAHVIRMIAYVRKKTGQAPILVTHSMGGIITTLALEGVVTDNSGGAGVSPELRMWMDQNVVGLVKLASPNRANPNMNPFEKWASETALAALLQPQSATLSPPELETFLRMNPIAAFSLSGLVDVYDFSIGEFAKFMARVDGHAPDDLKNALSHLGTHQNMSSDNGTLDYEELIFHGSSIVPRTVEVAHNDILANYDSVKEEAQDRGAPFTETFTGHLGVISGDTLRNTTIPAIESAQESWSSRIRNLQTQ